MKIVISEDSTGRIPKEIVKYLASKGNEEAIYQLQTFVYNEYYFLNDFNRKDPILIEACEKFNPSELKVVEIPDGVDYYIKQNEGAREYIVERSRTWS